MVCEQEAASAHEDLSQEDVGRWYSSGNREPGNECTCKSVLNIDLVN